MSSDDGTKGAAHDECVVTPNEDSHEEEATWNPFEEFHDEVELSVVPKVMQADGMPSVSAPYDDDRSDIPPFGPDTLICMACSRSSCTATTTGTFWLVFPQTRWSALRVAPSSQMSGT